MAYIDVPRGVPGIRSLMMFRPETGKHLSELAEALIRNPSGSLTAAEKELIAAYTSSRNDCMFCMSSHAAAARFLYEDDGQVVDFVLEDFENAPISSKLKALLRIAGKVQEDARIVTTELVEAAKELGASDRDIHDTVLIAAAFCMFNRYVDGLGSLTPTDPKDYEAMGRRMGEIGYVPPQNSNQSADRR